MTIGQIAELKAIDVKTGSLYNALQDPAIHKIPTLMMIERAKLDNAYRGGR